MDNSENLPTTLRQKQTDAIRDAAAKAEKDGKLTKTQISVLNDQNWLRILTPVANGGLQLALPDALQVLEQLAIADSSAGWLAANSAIAGWAYGFVNAETAKELPDGEKDYITGSNDTGGTAERTKTGYTISGQWKHVAGIGDASAFVANCTITENGAAIKDETNKEQVLSFILLKKEINLVTWNPMGLIAAGIQDVEVSNLKVPANRAFIMTGAHASNNARLYQYPYLQLSEAVMSITVSGMATRFTELCLAMIGEMKDSHGAALTSDNMVEDTIARYTQKMNDARVKLYYAADLTWQACMNQQIIKDTILYKVSAAAQDLARKARECADALYPFCGIAAMDRTSEINRVWRDLHTASHERLVVFGGL